MLEFPRFVVMNKRTDDWQTHPEGSIAFGDRATLLSVCRKFTEKGSDGEVASYPLAKELHLDEKKGEVVNGVLLIPVCANFCVAIAPRWTEAAKPGTSAALPQKNLTDDF